MTKKKQKVGQKNPESAYFLKLVLLLIIGSLWIKMGNNQSWQIPIPLGLIIGLMLISHDRLKIDRKIDYAVLLVAMLIGFWAPIGLYISV